MLFCKVDHMKKRKIPNIVKHLCSGILYHSISSPVNQYLFCITVFPIRPCQLVDCSQSGSTKHTEWSVCTLQNHPSVQSTVLHEQAVVCSVESGQYTLHILQSDYSAHCTRYIVHSEHFTLYRVSTVQYSTVHCRVHIAHSTINTINSALSSLYRLSGSRVPILNSTECTYILIQSVQCTLYTLK